MVVDNEPAKKSGLSAEEIATMRRERDDLALRIRESEQTIERSRELLKRLDQILAASGGKHDRSQNHARRLGAARCGVRAALASGAGPDAIPGAAALPGLRIAA